MIVDKINKNKIFIFFCLTISIRIKNPIKKPNGIPCNFVNGIRPRKNPVKNKHKFEICFPKYSLVNVR